MAAALALSFQRGFAFYVFSTNSEISSLCVTSAKKWLAKCLSQETSVSEGWVRIQRNRCGVEANGRAVQPAEVCEEGQEAHSEEAQ